MIVVITGASSGIGRETAVACASRGDAVVLAARNEEDLRLVEKECAELGARALVVPTDAPAARAAEASVERAAGEFGRVDAVVHSAAVLSYGRFEEVPTEVFDRVLDTNVRGTANVARSSLAAFREQGCGHLVLLGSLLGDVVMPFLSPYVTSKWAVDGLARTLQVEARRTPGISVSLVAPAGVRTPIYALAANYAGRKGRTPPPSSSAEKAARSVLAVLDRPRREKRIGLVNPVTAFAFRTVPWLYDALATPYFEVGGLTRRSADPHPGNAFESLPHDDVAYGR